MRLPKDLLSGTYRKPNIYLCQTNKERICLLNTNSENGTFKFNSYSELEFNVPSIYNDIVTGETKLTPYYDYVEGLRLVYLEGFGYFQLQNPELVSNGIQEYKHINAYSLEYSLSQKYLETFVINKGTTESIDGVTLYNPTDVNHSLLHLVLEKALGWHIGHVDDDLRTQGRSFEIDRQSIYDFLTNDMCDTYKCYVLFDTIDNTVNVYSEEEIERIYCDGIEKSFVLTNDITDTSTVSINGHETIQYTYDVYTKTITFQQAPSEGDILEIVDNFKSKYDTDVFVTFRNLSNEMRVNYSSDDIKTVLTVTGADDLNIRAVNFGLSSIMNLDYYHTIEWMGQELYDAYTLYVDKQDKYMTGFYDESTVGDANALLVVSSNPSDGEILLSDVKPTMLSYEPKVGDYVLYVDGYTQLLESIYNLIDQELGIQNSVPDEYDAHFEERKINQGDSVFDQLNDADIETLGYIRKISVVDGNDDVISFTYYVCQMKFSIDSNGNNVYIYSWVERNMTFGDKGVNLIKEDIDVYSTINQVQIDAGWNNEIKSENYQYYMENLEKLNAAKEALKIQEDKIKKIKEEREAASQQISNISSAIDLKNNFTYENLERLSLFLREDEYSDDCFVVTSIDTDKDKIDTQKELLVAGYKELKKKSKPTLSFTMSMKNIYAMPEFEPILHQFELGNFIKVAIRDNYIKKARLLEVKLNFQDFNNFSCTFGDLLSAKDQGDIHAELLRQAITAGKSVSNSSSYWQNGADIANEINDKIKQGLIDATTSIKSNSAGQNISWDNYGIHLRKIVDGILDRHEGWLTNNQFLYSDNNFETTKSVFGEYKLDGETYWGVLAECVSAGLVEGSQMIGGSIKIGEQADGTYAFKVDPDGTVTMNKGDLAEKLTYFSFDGEHGLVIGQNNTGSYFSRVSPDKISFCRRASFLVVESEPTHINTNYDYYIYKHTQDNIDIYEYYKMDDLNTLVDTSVGSRISNDDVVFGITITYFSNNTTFMKQAEIEGNLKVGTGTSRPSIEIGNYQIRIESNESLSICSLI